MDDKIYYLASAIDVSEEQESSDIFLLVKLRILDTQPNGNKQGVTEAFIDEIVANPNKYACVPLYADTDRLLASEYGLLGHMYDKKSGEFFTQQIGAITNFEKVQDEYGSSLIGEARIPKREADICERIMELYELGALNFSFEIKYVPSATIVKDGVVYVDANEANSFTGVAVVSVPAYQESVALQMVAEADNEVKKMTLEEAMAALAERDEMIAQKDEELANKDKVIAERDQAIAELNAAIAAKEEEKPACAEAEEDEEKPAEETEEEKPEEANAEQETATAGCYEIECLQNEIDRLRVELAASEAAKAELEALKAEMVARELEKQQAVAKAFAEKQGLNAEDEAVAKAIAELDYKMLAELSMAQENDAPAVVVASMVTDGIEIKGDKYDYLLAPRSKE